MPGYVLLTSKGGRQKKKIKNIHPKDEQNKTLITR